MRKKLKLMHFIRHKMFKKRFFFCTSARNTFATSIAFFEASLHQKQSECPSNSKVDDNIGTVKFFGSKTVDMLGNLRCGNPNSNRIRATTFTFTKVGVKNSRGRQERSGWRQRRDALVPESQTAIQLVPHLLQHLQLQGVKWRVLRVGASYSYAEWPIDVTNDFPISDYHWELRPSTVCLNNASWR